MFTGIINQLATITEVIRKRESTTIWVKTHFDDIQEGESIAIDGMCVTAVDPEAGIFRADLSPETLSLTIANDYQVGQSINVERAMRPIDRFGGHVVTGHIDTVAQLAEKQSKDEFIEYRFDGIAKEYRQTLVKKGSIAVNGVSLTLNSVYNECFSVMLIPHTLSKTNLGALEVGQAVNIECDYLAKIVLNKEECSNG